MCLNVWLYTQSQAEPWTPATGQRRESAPPVWVRKVQGLTHCHMPCASSLDCRSKPCTPNGKSPSTSPCPWCLTSMVEAKPEAASDQRTKDPPNNQLSQVKSPKGKTDIHPGATRCNQVQPSTTKHNQVQPSTPTYTHVSPRRTDLASLHRVLPHGCKGLETPQGPSPGERSPSPWYPSEVRRHKSVEQGLSLSGS